MAAEKADNLPSDEELDRLMLEKFKRGELNVDSLPEDEVDHLMKLNGLDPDGDHHKMSWGDLGKSALETAGDIGSSVAKGAFDLAQGTGKVIDSVTGAPTREAVTKSLEPIKPEEDWGPDLLVRAGKGIGGFFNAFAQDPEKSASPTDEAHAMGFSDRKLFEDRPKQVPEDPEKFKEFISQPGMDPTSFLGMKGADVVRENATPANVAAIPLGVATDWTMLIPPLKGAEQVAKMAGFGVLKGTEGAIKGGAKAIDLAVGTEKASKAVKTGEEIAAQTWQDISHLLTPKVANDADEMFAIAAKNGIDPKDLPDAVEFGKNSAISRHERWRAEGPLGEAKLKKWEAATDKVDDAIQGQVAKVANGNPLDEVSAGARIKEAFDRKVRSYFDQFETTYGNIGKAAPGLYVDPEGIAKINAKLRSVEKIAERKIEMGTNSTVVAQGKELMMKVERLKKASGSWEGTVQALRDIGEDAYQAKRNKYAIPEDTQITRDLYHSVRDALVDTAKKEFGQEIADTLVENNKMMSSFLDDKSMLSKILGQKYVADEEVFRNLISNGNTEQIRALKGMLEPDDLAHVKGALLESLIRRDAEGGLSYRGLHNALTNRRTRLVIQSLFEPQEVQPIAELVRLGDRLGQPVLSSSGTGASNSFSNLRETVSNVLLNDSVAEKAKDAARAAKAREVSPPMLPAPKSLPGKVIDAPASALRNRTNLGHAFKISQVGAALAMSPQQLEGYPVSSLIDVAPEEVEPLVQEVQKSQMSNIEKAKIINLMRKHHKMPAQ